MTGPASPSTFELVAPDGSVRRIGTATGAANIVRRPATHDGVLGFDVETDEPCTLEWWWPTPESVGVWRPLHTSTRDLPPDWGSQARRDVRSSRSAPVASLVDAADLNRLTVSLSASVRGCDFLIGVDEANGEQHVRIVVRDVAPVDGRRRFTVRVDTRPLHFAEVLREVGDEWGRELRDAIATVPSLAHDAMYSTWYSEHQEISAAAVERHARSAVDYGCRAIIVDGGWQNDDTAGDYDGVVNAYYASCGDWLPDPARFPDMPAHVKKVQESGLAYVLWIAPPFLGDRSTVWERFKDRTLDRRPADRFAVLDPRYPEVREHILETCIRPVRDWGVDGLKIDFVDQWARSADPAGPGADCVTVDEGVERLLADIASELRRLTSRLLTEFRQDYVHPRLWQFGTFVRANDCPADALENRVRTIDLRLISGGRAVHSDMLMWHPEAPAPQVASQFINTLFSTPQVSMDLDALSADHAAVVHFWLGFARDHADALLHGRLTPSRPDARYTQVRADGASESVVAVFSDPVVRLSDAPLPLTIVNGSGGPRILLDGGEGTSVDLTVLDCAGVELDRWAGVLPEVLPIAVPVSGLVRVKPA